jgi:hypothetical protein
LDKNALSSTFKPRATIVDKNYSSRPAKAYQSRPSNQQNINQASMYRSAASKWKKEEYEKERKDTELLDAIQLKETISGPPEGYPIVYRPENTLDRSSE